MANTFESTDEVARAPLPSRLAASMGVACSACVLIAAAAGAHTATVVTFGFTACAVILAVNLSRERVLRAPPQPLGEVYGDVVIRAPKAWGANPHAASGADAA